MNFIIIPYFILKLQEGKEHLKKNVSTRLFIVDSQDNQH